LATGENIWEFILTNTHAGGEAIDGGKREEEDLSLLEENSTPPQGKEKMKERVVSKAWRGVG
jgi:hypothetical protein